MEGEESEQLFLLEFLVDSVTIKKPNFVENSIPSHLTTIFQFLKYPPLEIREKDQHNKGDEVPTFKIGKSCLFAVPSKKLVEVSKLFNLKVSVARRFPQGVLPEKTFIGETSVDISSDFASVVTEVLTNPQAIPKSKSIKNNFVLKNNGEGPPVGNIFLFLRISCFGKLIVNEFQLSTEHSAALLQNCNKEEEVNKKEKDLSHLKALGLNEEILDCCRLDMERSPSGSLLPVGDSDLGMVGEEDFTEVGAKVQGRWFTIRVPKEKLRSHVGDGGGGGVGIVGGSGGGGGGSGGVNSGLGMGLDPAITAALSGRPQSGRYDSTTRNIMLKLLQQQQHQGQQQQQQMVTGVMGVGMSQVARSGDSTPASLPTSREGDRRGGSRSPIRGRPTSTPVGSVPSTANASTPDGKCGKGKGKNAKAKVKTNERGEKKKKKVPRLRAL